MSQITPDQTLLGLIAIRPRHGYHLLDCFQDRDQLGEVWNLSTSQLYAVLKRLQAQGLTEGRAVLGADSPTRTEYRLTDLGEACLTAWLDEESPSPSIHRVRVEFLSRLYIARLLNIPTLPIVAHQKASCQAYLTTLREALTHAALGVGWLTLSLMIAQYEVILLWLDRCELSPHPFESEQG